jgi:hypothetical protein
MVVKRYSLRAIVSSLSVVGPGVSIARLTKMRGR